MANKSAAAANGHPLFGLLAFCFFLYAAVATEVGVATEVEAAAATTVEACALAILLVGVAGRVMGAVASAAGAVGTGLITEVPNAAPAACGAIDVGGSCTGELRG